jgi:hypothetical protein
MDIRCPICGEPWDIDSIHDRVAELHPGEPWLRPDGRYEQARYDKYLRPVKQDFQTRGCVALGGSAEWCQPSQRGQTASAIYDLLGDDLDGAAAMLEDADLLGL